MIREKVARALTAHDLAPAPDTERPIDVVGAMGAISRFASLLYRLKYGGDVTSASIERAGLRLARRLHNHRRVPVPDAVKRIALLALNEWLLDRCIVCRGRSTIGGRAELSATRYRACRACQATGLIRRVTARGMQLITPCPHCRGRRYVEVMRTVQDEPIRVCHACGGTGRLAVSDLDRARLLDINTEQAQGVRKQIDHALDILRQADRIAAGLLRQQLAEPASPESDMTRERSASHEC